MTAQSAQNLLGSELCTLDPEIADILHKHVVIDHESREPPPPPCLAHHDDLSASCRNCHESNDSKEAKGEINVLTEEQLLERARNKIKEELCKLASFHNERNKTKKKTKKKSKKSEKKKRRRSSSSLRSRDSEDSRRQAPAPRARGACSHSSRDRWRSSRDRSCSSRDRSRSSRDKWHSTRNRWRSTRDQSRSSRDRSRSSRDRSRPPCDRWRSTRERSRSDSRGRYFSDRRSYVRPTTDGRPIEIYRPNISEWYQSHRPPVDNPTHGRRERERRIERELEVKKKLKAEERENRENRIAEEKTEAIKREAVKDILLDLEEPLTELIEESEASDEARRRVLVQMFESVSGRVRALRVRAGEPAARAVRRYRARRSRRQDEAQLAALLAAARAALPELSTTVLDELDDILQGLDVAQLSEGVEPKIEVDDIKEEEGEITNIVITIVPTAAPAPPPAPARELYTMCDRDYGYYVHVTVRRDRVFRYYLTIKKLFSKMKPYMYKLTAYIQTELFLYVMRIKLEAQIKELLLGVEPKLKAKDVVKLYRTKYPEETDEEAVFETLCAVWRGEYNDTDDIDESSEGNLVIVKKENDNELEVSNLDLDKSGKDNDQEVLNLDIVKNEKDNDQGILNLDIAQKEKDNDQEVLNLSIVKIEKDNDQEELNLDIVKNENDKDQEVSHFDIVMKENLMP